MSNAFAVKEKAFVLTIENNEDTLTMLDAKTDYFSIPQDFEKGTHTLKLIDMLGSAIYEKNIVLDDIALITPSIDCLVNGTNVCSDNYPKLKYKKVTMIIIPYESSGNFVEIYDSFGVMTLRYDLSSLSSYCGDKICNDNEDSSSCPLDCNVQTSDTYLGDNNIRTLIILLIAAALIITFVIIVMHYKRK